jgi:hypothetical protein
METLQTTKRRCLDIIVTLNAEGYCFYVGNPWLRMHQEPISLDLTLASSGVDLVNRLLSNSKLGRFENSTPSHEEIEGIGVDPEIKEEWLSKYVWLKLIITPNELYNALELYDE